MGHLTKWSELPAVGRNQGSSANATKRAQAFENSACLRCLGEEFQGLGSGCGFWGFGFGPHLAASSSLLVPNPLLYLLYLCMLAFPMRSDASCVRGPGRIRRAAWRYSEGLVFKKFQVSL